MRWKFYYSTRHTVCKDSLEAAIGVVDGMTYSLHETPTGAVVYKGDSGRTSTYLILPEYHPMFNLDVIVLPALRHANKIQNYVSYLKLETIYLSEY